MHVLIPAYQPGEPLVLLVRELAVARPSAEVLIVDDGSDDASREVLAACEAAGAVVLHLPANRGKGYALRAGFSHLRAMHAHGAVVTADADGQHAVADVLAAADAVDLSVDAGPHLVIGERRLDLGVPWRSRVGNTVSRQVFRAATGRRLRDTQTGLRAFSTDLLPWLTGLRGDRYEYELVMLLRAVREHVAIRSVTIRTIYVDDNSSSHFRPVADSLRIYAPLLVFLASSLASFAVDTAVLLGLHALLGALLPAVVGARLVSGATNFALNRHFVFPGSRRADDRVAAVRYVLLAGVLLVANYVLLSTLYAAGVGLLPAKVVTEVALVAVSYVVQARFVFAHRRQARTAAAFDSRRDTLRLR